MIRKDVTVSLTDAQYDSLLHAITSTLEMWAEVGMAPGARSGLRRAGLAISEAWEKAPQKAPPSKRKKVA